MDNTKAADIQLPSIRVDVVEPGTRPRRNWIKCAINENLEFKTEGLESYCFAEWESLVYDAFLIAAAVQFCDHAKARPATGWGRDIALRVPVHDPVHWSGADVSGTLHTALKFLTGDQWNISFTGRKTPEPPPRQGQFRMPDGFARDHPVQRRNRLPHRRRINEARIRQPPNPGKTELAIFETHATWNTAFPLRLRFPTKVRAGKTRFVETSARSRGFRFALLSGIAAYLSQTETIVVSESGQGALGPTLVPVGQAYEDYRNHPLFTVKMEAFILALLGHQVRYIFPRLWHTKGETLAEYVAKCPDCPDWEETRSCWQLQRQVSVAGPDAPMRHLRRMHAQTHEYSCHRRNRET